MELLANRLKKKSYFCPRNQTHLYYEKATLYLNAYAYI